MQTLHCSLTDKNLCHRAITEKLGSEKLASISQVVNNHGLKRNCEVDFQLYSEKYGIRFFCPDCLSAFNMKKKKKKADREMR